MKKELKSGYTTGACATAAVQAILTALKNKECLHQVSLQLPQGDNIIIPIKKMRLSACGGEAQVIKDGGDDPDITHGTTIITNVEITPNCSDVIFLAGAGVGIVTKPGLAIPVGEPAINPVPRAMMTKVARSLLPPRQGCKITISVPDGVRLSQKTLNPVLGIQGGISIIGTSGIVRPMSEDAFKRSLTPQIDLALAAKQTSLVFVPGKIGENIARSFAIPTSAIVQTSNFIGYMLEYAAQTGVKEILLCGHLGKLVKVAAGNMHTHNRISDARMETLAAYAALLGVPPVGIKQILEATITEEIFPLLKKYQIADKLFSLLCEKASQRAMRYVHDELLVGTIMVTLQGEILGLDKNAMKIGASFPWNIKSS